MDLPPSESLFSVDEMASDISFGGLSSVSDNGCERPSSVSLDTPLGIEPCPSRSSNESDISSSLPPLYSFLVFKVQFKSTTDDFFLADCCPRNVSVGDWVRVEADRGHDIGIVADMYWPTAEVLASMLSSPNRRILSFANEEEVLLSKLKARDELRALNICQDVVASRGMHITLVDAEYQCDRKKLTFFFTSNGHTDFRDLVRDLFSIFKTRIWMQKIKPYEAAAFQYDNCPIPRCNNAPLPSSRCKKQQPINNYYSNENFPRGSLYSRKANDEEQFLGNIDQRMPIYESSFNQFNLPMVNGLLGRAKECFTEPPQPYTHSHSNSHRASRNVSSTSFNSHEYQYSEHNLSTFSSQASSRFASDYYYRVQL